MNQNKEIILEVRFTIFKTISHELRPKGVSLSQEKHWLIAKQLGCIRETVAIRKGSRYSLPILLSCQKFASRLVIRWAT